MNSFKKGLQDELAKYENEIKTLENERALTLGKIGSDVKAMSDEIMTMERRQKIYEDVLKVVSLKRKRDDDGNETGMFCYCLMTFGILILFFGHRQYFITTTTSFGDRQKGSNNTSKTPN